MQSVEIVKGKKWRYLGRKEFCLQPLDWKFNICSRYPWSWGCWPTAQISELLVLEIIQANFLDLYIISVNYLFWYLEVWKELISSSGLAPEIIFFSDQVDNLFQLWENLPGHLKRTHRFPNTESLTVNSSWFGEAVNILVNVVNARST